MKFFANIFVVPWPAVFIIYLSIHEKAFVILPKTMKFQPSESFPIYGMYSANIGSREHWGIWQIDQSMPIFYLRKFLLSTNTLYVFDLSLKCGILYSK